MQAGKMLWGKHKSESATTAGCVSMLLQDRHDFAPQPTIS